jgi:hypothetical protein
MKGSRNPRHCGINLFETRPPVLPTLQTLARVCFLAVEEDRLAAHRAAVACGVKQPGHASAQLGRDHPPQIRSLKQGLFTASAFVEIEPALQATVQVAGEALEEDRALDSERHPSFIPLFGLHFLRERLGPFDSVTLGLFLQEKIWGIPHLILGLGPLGRGYP